MLVSMILRLALAAILLSSSATASSTEAAGVVTCLLSAEFNGTRLSIDYVFQQSGEVLRSRVTQHPSDNGDTPSRAAAAFAERLVRIEFQRRMDPESATEPAAPHTGFCMRYDYAPSFRTTLPREKEVITRSELEAAGAADADSILRYLDEIGAFSRGF